MDNEICNVIDKLAEKFGIAVNWGSNNIVTYIQDLMARYSYYEIIRLSIAIIFATISIIFCAIGMFLWFKKLQYDTEHNLIKSDELSMPAMMLWVYGLILGFMLILACCSICKLFQWVYMPDFMFMKEVLEMVG